MTIFAERVAFRGWRNCYRLTNGALEAVVLADVGPRILFFGFCGQENQLYEAEKDLGQTGGSEFRLYGGHRLWVSPEVERTYYPDNFPVSVSNIQNGLRFTAPVEANPPGTNLQKEIELEFKPDFPRLFVRHRITDHDSMPTELSVWAPTLMRAGGKAILPLPPIAAMDKNHLLPTTSFAMWSYTDLSDPRWKIGAEFVQLCQSNSPAGRFSEQMGGLFNPSGWGAYFREGNLFVKQAPVVPEARYPDFGCNFETFTNPDFLELETLAPLVELAPGQTASHEEVWSLYKDIPAGDSEDWIRNTIVPVISGNLHRS
jgi:hypothetical protein